MRPRVLLGWVVLIGLAIPASGLAAERALSRGDLARALRRFEAAWDEKRATLGDAAKAEVAGHVTKATFGFFSNDYDASTGEMARATAALRGTAPSFEGLSLRARAAVAEGTASLDVSLARPGALATDAAEAVVSVERADGGAVARAKLSFDARATEARATLDVSALAAGRATLVVASGGVELERRPLDVIAGLAPRLERLDAALKGIEGPRLPTLRARRKRVARALSGSKDDGVDRDLGGEIAALESDTAALALGQDPFPHRAGDELRVASKGGEEVVYRLFVPAGAASRKAPLVIALHGVGGDEDMFCEAYGRGIVRRLAVEAGAIFASPRSAPSFGGGGAAHVRAVRDDIARDYAVGEVFLVGHSMGAGQVAEALASDPALYKAAALFGGPAGRPEGKGSVPVFVAVGSTDFARPGAKAYADAARRAGWTVRYDEREGLEHLLIVREAAPEAFAFFKEHGLVARRYY